MKLITQFLTILFADSIAPISYIIGIFLFTLGIILTFNVEETKYFLLATLIALIGAGIVFYKVWLDIKDLRKDVK